MRPPAALVLLALCSCLALPAVAKPAPKSKSAKAMSQLRFVQRRSAAAASGPGAEAASRRAADAFEPSAKGDAPPEQKLKDAPALAQTPTEPRGTDRLERGSAPGGFHPDIPPTVGPAGNVTPYDPAIDRAARDLRDARKLRQTGRTLIIAGAVLLGVGLLLATLGKMLVSSGELVMGNWLVQAGTTLALVGGLLLGAGVALWAWGEKKARDAEDEAVRLVAEHGQHDQGRLIGLCAELVRRDLPCK